MQDPTVITLETRGHARVWKQVCFSVWNNGKSNSYKSKYQSTINGLGMHMSIIMKVE
jgi:hypothetical protein